MLAGTGPFFSVIEGQRVFVYLREVVASCKWMKFKRNCVFSSQITVREPDWGHYDDVNMLNGILVPKISIKRKQVQFVVNIVFYHDSKNCFHTPSNTYVIQKVHNFILASVYKEKRILISLHMHHLLFINNLQFASLFS